MGNLFSSHTNTVWAKIVNDKSALFGIAIIAIAIIVSILGAHIRPDKSQNADQKALAYAQKKPGFSGKFLRVKKSSISNEGSSGLFFGGLVDQYDYYPFYSYSLEDGKVIIEEINGENEVLEGSKLIFELSTISDEPITSQNFEEMCIIQKSYLLGTDKFGRDMLSRLMGGTIISLSVGCIAVLISLLIGISLGSIAAYFGGWIDALIMWLVNVIWSIPTLLIVIALTLLFGKGFIQVFIAVGLTMWVEVARVVRGEILSLKNKEFVEAAKSLGYSDLRILVKHILPNALDPVIVISAANFATAILLEAGLSFLGIGTQVPMPSWGYMIKEHYAYITTDLAYLAILPGLCIMFLVLAFTLIGNSLRNALDVRAIKA